MWPIVLEVNNEILPTLRAFNEDVFGPLALLIKVKDEDEAIEIANSSRFGLDAAVFTTCEKRARKVARKLEVGSVFINEYPRHGIGYYPFGGMKDSGIGREGIGYSLEMLTTTKTIVHNFRGQGVWYLEGMLSSETLPGKYAKVIEAHKSVWAREGMFKDRDIFGFAVAMSSYLDIFGSREETLRYLELSAEVRSKHSAYKKYPRGTNFWLWVGKRDEGVLNSVYRRADYVLRTRSRFTEEGIKRELLVLKTPELVEEIKKIYG